MADYKVDFRDVKFVLNEYLGLDDLCEFPRFKESDFDADMLNDMVQQGLKLAQETLAPVNKEGDEVGAKHEDGQVKVPKCYHEPYWTYVNNGWGATTSNPAYGGMGLPEIVNTCVGEFFSGANCSFAMMPGLTKSAAYVIDTFCSDEQKDKYLEKMYTGEWAGTMCLTEPQAGSDVGASKTMAYPIEGKENLYKIVGNKQFITFGDNDITENVIHLVLARTPGAPAGTKGIGLFIVPRNVINEDGSSGDNNDVQCASIEHKMGIHGSPTCVLNFGDNENCVGELIGDVYSGIKYMFLMMNEERLMVGMQGMAMAGAAYMAALQYSQERQQGSHITKMKDPEAPKVTIDQHPDVRRMLMTMKAYTEGMRALLYTTGKYIDYGHWSNDEEQKKKHAGFVELLTPICKAYCSDTAFRVTEMAMQTHGGYGYCAEYPVEQFCRDTKITSIYEGANAIQALDLLGRKLPMKGGSVMMAFVQDINERLGKLKDVEATSDMSAKLTEVLNKIQSVVMKFMGLTKEKSEQAFVPFVHACDLLEMLGDFLCGFYLAEEAAIADEKFKAICKEKGASDDAAVKALIKDSDEAKFYYGKVQTADFYMKQLLPRVFWKESAIMNLDTSCMSDVFPSLVD